MRFLGIGKRVKDEINKHIACLAKTQPNPPKPLQSPPMPPHEWHEVKTNRVLKCDVTLPWHPKTQFQQTSCEQTPLLRLLDFEVVKPNYFH